MGAGAGPRTIRPLYDGIFLFRALQNDNIFFSSLSDKIIDANLPNGGS